MPSSAGGETTPTPAPARPSGGAYAVGASSSSEASGPGVAIARAQETARQRADAAQQSVLAARERAEGTARQQLATVQARFEERPELEVGAAFAGGFLVAQLLKLVRRG